MKRTAFAAAAVTVALSAVTVGGMATAADPEVAAALDTGSHSVSVLGLPQRVEPASRPLMRQVPDQRVAGITEHVDQSCTGTGDDGKRVQVLYVHSRTQPDLTAAKSAQILDEVRTADDVFAASAAKTGGGLRVRWVYGAGCTPTITDVAVSPAALADKSSVMKAELRAQGFDRDDRKYLVFSESNQNCGTSDGNVPASVSRIDKMCWPSATTSFAAHELGHALGAVSGAAPHESGWGHCTETGDLMCNGQRSPEDPAVHACPAWQGNWFDCGNDDYFSTDPAPGSFLDSSYNIARSPFLDTVAPLPGAPQVKVTAQAIAGQAVVVRATAPTTVAGWKFPPVAGDCRLDTSRGGPLLKTQAGTARYSCLQEPGTTAQFDVQALGFNHRVGYGSTDLVVRGAPVSVRFSGRPAPGHAFTATAVGSGGDDDLSYWWKAPGCRQGTPQPQQPTATFVCSSRMAGRSVRVEVSVYKRNGDQFKASGRVRIGRR